MRKHRAGNRDERERILRLDLIEERAHESREIAGADQASAYSQHDRRESLPNHEPADVARTGPDCNSEPNLLSAAADGERALFRIARLRRSPVQGRQTRKTGSGKSAECPRLSSTVRRSLPPPKSSLSCRAH